jgi:hypothetical protein
MCSHFILCDCPLAAKSNNVNPLHENVNPRGMSIHPARRVFDAKLSQKGGTTSSCVDPRIAIIGQERYAHDQ